MDKNETLKRLQQVFRAVFDDEDLLINEATSAADIEDWDSLNNVRLIVAVEKEFEIRIKASEVSQLDNVGQFANSILKLRG